MPLSWPRPGAGGLFSTSAVSRSPSSSASSSTSDISASAIFLGVAERGMVSGILRVVKVKQVRSKVGASQAVTSRQERRSTNFQNQTNKKERDK